MNWCEKLKDETRINQIAIPGTHDSSAWTHHENFPGIPGAWAQRKSIEEQLEMGVRAFDLRVGCASNIHHLGLTSFIGMYHGPIYLNLTLNEVLITVRKWLDKNPKEFLILIFQQQGKFSSRDDISKGVSTSLKQHFGDKLLESNPAMQEWPTCGEVRNKVIVMNRMRSPIDDAIDVRSWLTDGDNSEGIELNTDSGVTVYLQDKYKGISKESGFETLTKDNIKKFAVFKAAAVIDVNKDTKLLGINHLSYSNLRYQPWSSGEGVNILLQENNMKTKGLIMADDADSTTVEHIINMNSEYSV
ncbi:phosphatidylinositol-specific phospholipase C domain-containing protein [Colwellia psychrerythraea]|uniref:1-phosphatidylinositol phosphodiesterase n=1 Tax=Colwellia psychrerythraea TaxID=28229 RepID=A0A099KC78_COLPS|nr:phosphatidylinositol-specific phospholipase C domain-containing protein [Colwellia psychrerythraea]KGJ87950.1 phosphatidylinositol-specific phospholipase C X region [Colwellia psychrerythraea]